MSEIRDTVINGQIPDLNIKYQGIALDFAFGKVDLEPEAEKKIRDWVQNIREAQAEISFKAGWEAHKKIVPEQLKAHGDICYKAGIREVVETVKPIMECLSDPILQRKWQAKLKEWGIGTLKKIEEQKEE